MSKRVLVIGLDALDKYLVKDWIKEGVLPNFRRFLLEGLGGDVENAHALEAGSAWPDFYYGSWPSTHGQYSALKHFDPKTYAFRTYLQEELPCDPIWTALAQQGKRSFIIDAPYIYLPDHPNCTAIFNWGTHTQAPECARIDPITQPQDLRSEIVAKFGTDPLGGVMCDYLRPRSTKELIWFRDRLLERIEKRKEMAAHYLQKAGWEFFLVIFSEAHCAGHHGWHLHDPSHLEFDPEVAAQVGDIMKNVYIGLDSAVGDLMDNMDDDTTVILYFSHGMETGYSGTLFLDRILRQLEARTPTSSTGESIRFMARETWARTWRISPKPIKALLNPIRKKARKAIYNEGLLPNPETRKFFEVFANDRSSGVRINLSGREKCGTVEPGQDYENVCNYLVSELSKVQKKETGEPAFLEIVRTDQEYSGKMLQKIPDLVVTWNRATPLRAVVSPTIGEVEHRFQTVRTGDHRPDGMFIALGANISPAYLNEVVQAIDFAPTVASLLGVDTRGFEGSAISAICPSS